MEWGLALIELIKENGRIFKDNFPLFLMFGIIIVAIMLLFWRLRYGDRLRELPNLAKIEDDLRKSREENVRLSKENRKLRTEINDLNAEIAALQTDRELLEGIKPSQAAGTLGERISKALNS